MTHMKQSHWYPTDTLSLTVGLTARHATDTLASCRAVTESAVSSGFSRSEGLRARNFVYLYRKMCRLGDNGQDRAVFHLLSTRTLHVLSRPYQTLTGRLELSEGILNVEMVVDVLTCHSVCLWFVLNGTDRLKMCIDICQHNANPSPLRNVCNYVKCTQPVVQSGSLATLWNPGRRTCL